eukprot:227193_1
MHMIRSILLQKIVTSHHIQHNATFGCFSSHCYSPTDRNPYGFPTEGCMFLTSHISSLLSLPSLDITSIALSVIHRSIIDNKVLLSSKCVSLHDSNPLLSPSKHMTSISILT